MKIKRIKANLNKTENKISLFHIFFLVFTPYMSGVNGQHTTDGVDRLFNLNLLFYPKYFFIFGEHV